MDGEAKPLFNLRKKENQSICLLIILIKLDKIIKFSSLTKQVSNLQLFGLLFCSCLFRLRRRGAWSECVLVKIDLPTPPSPGCREQRLRRWSLLSFSFAPISYFRAWMTGNELELSVKLHFYVIWHWVMQENRYILFRLVDALSSIQELSSVFSWIIDLSCEFNDIFPLEINFICYRHPFRSTSSTHWAYISVAW